MVHRLIISTALVFSMFALKAQVYEKGPYTVSQISAGVFHIEDANSSNPAGNHKTDGKTNNCSDMYLIVGKDHALLIDLSNFIKWDTSAVGSLRSIVSKTAAGRKLYITVTHNHGDHLGMLPAFIENKEAAFWIPAEEFSSREIFPKDRTTYFPENASIDLGGGFTVNSYEVPGHTAHSTIFFLKGRNLAFTGDAIGSGNGVWIFSYDSFLSYRKSIEKLIDYISEPSSQVDPKQLIIYGGHYWQKGEKEKLDAQYIYDMRSLIGKIGDNSAHEEKVTYNKYLDTNFRYRTATITWNKADQMKYSGSK